MNAPRLGDILCIFAAEFTTGASRPLPSRRRQGARASHIPRTVRTRRPLIGWQLLPVVSILLAIAIVTGCSREPMPADEVDPTVQTYVDAVNGADPRALVEAFADDGEVIDAGREIGGHEAIRQWARDEVIGGSLRIFSILEQRADGQRLLVLWARSGSAGRQAYYNFTVLDGKIRIAELQYA
jgi:hypothetical protein